MNEKIETFASMLDIATEEGASGRQSTRKSRARTARCVGPAPRCTCAFVKSPVRVQAVEHAAQGGRDRAGLRAAAGARCTTRASPTRPTATLWSRACTCRPRSAPTRATARSPRCCATTRRPTRASTACSSRSSRAREVKAAPTHLIAGTSTPTRATSSTTCSAAALFQQDPQERRHHERPPKLRQRAGRHARQRPLPHRRRHPAAQGPAQRRQGRGGPVRPLPGVRGGARGAEDRQAAGDDAARGRVRACGKRGGSRRRSSRCRRPPVGAGAGAGGAGGAEGAGGATAATR